MDESTDYLMLIVSFYHGTWGVFAYIYGITWSFSVFRRVMGGM